MSGAAEKSMPRREAFRLVAGRGRYTDDIDVAGLLHVAFLRSPYPHARIDEIDVRAAKLMPGVVAVLTAADLAKVCKPWQTRLAQLPSHVSLPQHPLAMDEACWQGEPVVAVVAASRALAEDAIEHLTVRWTELAAVADTTSAASPGASRFHTSAGRNLGLDHSFSAGDVEAAFRDAAVVVAHDFIFDRQTGVTLEPRTIVAVFDLRLRELTITHSHQAPHQTRDIVAAQLGLPMSAVRVIVPDVGGAFGLKLAAYPDEMAVAAISMLLGKPVKFCADRLESFASDNHAREICVKGRLALDAAGMLLAMDVAITSGFGAYSAYPRGSVGEGLQAAHMSAAPYRLANFHGHVRGYFQNKVPTGVLRAVGQPIATTVTEQLLDLAARKLGIDPADLRRRNYADAASTATRSAGGIALAELSLERCHDRLLDVMGYATLRHEQESLRRRNIYRGVGIAAFIEQTAVGSQLYGPQNVRASARETCRLSLEPDGSVLCAASLTDQGQGTRTAIIQIVAEEFGIDPDSVDLVTGDTQTTPFGGGAWASRGVALGGEAALRAARRLKNSVLIIAGALLQAEPSALSLVDGTIRNGAGLVQISLAEMAATVAFNAHIIPLAELPSLEIIESYEPRLQPYVAANGIQAAHVEVDPELGTIKVLSFWVVHDCGRVINSLLVDEQIRGGVVQGIGAALYEQCIYGDGGQLENASLVDYLVPMAGEMPDIHVHHVSTPTTATALGARGVGEAGTVGAAAAIWTAVNDALVPFGAVLTAQPFTPERVLDHIASARRADPGKKPVSIQDGRLGAAANPDAMQRAM